MGNDFVKGTSSSESTPVEGTEFPELYPALICEVELLYKNGKKEYIYSDEGWECALSKVVFSDIYDGEVYDANYEEIFVPVKPSCFKSEPLIASCLSEKHS